MALHWDRLYHLVSRSLSESSEGRVVLVSPYITTSLIERMAPLLSESEVTVLTSWKESNLVQGSSSLDLYPICREHGWELRILNSLHAKIYATPRREMWVGSANMTGSGMGTSRHPNMEVLIPVEEPTESDWLSLDALLQSGLKVDDELHRAYSEWLARQPEYTPPELEKFTPPESTSILSLDLMPRTFTPIELYETLNDPASASEEQLEDANHDLAILRVSFDEDRDRFIESLRRSFFTIPLVTHLLGQLDEEWTRFGGMRTMMREACGGLDIVSRDDVTRCTQNLYEWVEDLDDSERFEFGIPRHSQLIRRK